MQMVNLRATLPRPARLRAGPADYCRPLRHQAVRGLHVRRRQRRRLERRVPDRDGARAQRPRRTRCRSSCCSSTARKRSSTGTGRTITPTAAGTTSRRRAQAGTLKDIRALILVDMIGDRDLRISARVELDAVADRHHLGRGEALEAPRVRRARNADRGRPPAVPRGRRAGRRHHRPRLPRLAHGRRHAGQGVGRVAAGGRRRAARGAAGDREAAAQAR